MCRVEMRSLCAPPQRANTVVAGPQARAVLVKVCIEPPPPVRTASPICRAEQER